MTTFRKEQKWPFDPTPGVVGVCNDSTLAFMVLCARFPLIWYATWLLSVKDIVWPFDSTPWVKGGSVGKIFATMLLPVSSALIWYATWLLSEKYIVWPFDPTPWVEGVCGQNICHHVAASVVSFNLICNMTIFWKSLILASAPPAHMSYKSTKGARNQAFKLKSCLICFISIAALPGCKISAKNINNCLSYWEI